MKSEQVERTFSDNIVEEWDRIFDEAGLTEWDKRAIIDLVLERTAEFFEAYANQWQPGSAFRAYHVSAFIRGLKDAQDRFGPTSAGCQDNPSDS